MRVTVKKPASRVSTAKLDAPTRVTKTRIGAVRSTGDAIRYSGSVPGADNVSAALDELAQRFFQSASAPTTGVNEGDLWYDLSSSKLKINDGDSWELISGAASSLEDLYFSFTASARLTSGNLAEFNNLDAEGNSETQFALTHDGVLTFKSQATTPTAITGGLHFKDNELYLGTEV